MQTFVDKVNAAIDRITGTFTRNGKTLTITADDGTPINIDLAATNNVVLSGLAITQDGVNQKLFNVATGTVRIEENEVVISAGSTSTANGDPTNPRIDALVVTDADTIKVTAGVAAATPTPPTVASNELIIGFIYVEANATDVAENVYLKGLFQIDQDGVYKKTGVPYVEVIDGVLESSVTSVYPFLVSINVGHSPYTSANLQFVNCDTSGGNITVTLPPASANTGSIISVKKTDAANTVTIDANGAETIDDALTATLSTQWEMISLVCDGSAWFIGN